MKVHDLMLNNILNQSSKDASVHFLQQRVLIFDALALGLLRKELIDSFGYHKARKVLTGFGFAHGWRTAKMLSDDLPEVLHDRNGGEHLHRQLGLVNTTNIEVHNRKTKDLLIRSEMENSYEAEQHINLIGPTDEETCWTLSGFASGYETFKQEREVYFIETKCVSKGDPYCQMEGRFKETWGDQINKHLPYFEVDGISKALVKHDFLAQQICNNDKSAMVDSPVDPIPGFIARSPEMIKLINIAASAARVDSTVLISGDSGVGKEHISRYVHQTSFRSDNPFISVNCAALSENLLEAELFGHAKGAFTGAHKARIGLFEEANGGTLFLDEIGEISLNMQVKLLRVLQEKEIKRIGENTSRKLDVRIIAATNRLLSDEVKKGNFRQDLYYRLRVIELKIPSLGQRREDILPIANAFLQKFSLNMKRHVIGLSRPAVKRLMDYPWPGNVRELANSMEYAVALCGGEWIEEDDLPPELLGIDKQSDEPDSLMPLAAVEKQHILAALDFHKGDKHATAAGLGIALSTLYRKLSLYELA